MNMHVMASYPLPDKKNFVAITRVDNKICVVNTSNEKVLACISMKQAIQICEHTLRSEWGRAA